MKKYNRYITGMLLLLPVCVLMQLFAYTYDNTRVFYCVLEHLGLYNGYKYSYRNIILWGVIIVLIVILLIVAFKLITSEKEIFRKNNFLRELPYLMICISIVCCFFFPKIDGLMLHFRHGLDSIIIPDRSTDSLLRFTGSDATGKDTGPLLSVSFESFASEDENFFVKFVNIEDETKQYIHSDENGVPIMRQMGKVSNIWDKDKGNYKARTSSFGIDLEKIIPDFVDTPENRRLIKFKVIIYNDTESKTFYYYYD